MRRALSTLLTSTSLTNTFLTSTSPTRRSLTGTVLKSILLASLSLAAAGTAFAGTLTDADKLNRLQPGKTTAPKTVELLGKPNQENRSPDGRFSYMYEFKLPNKADPSQPPAEGVAALMFSPKGVFEGMQLFKKAEDAAGAAQAPPGK